ncbi:histidine kinase [Halonotius terrestris]|uniref:Histidine kinase n=1 Tax=Halonotius terrestris TaxID=2487750 RepID=A0A8J8PDN2_9EURY|nr:FIST C-terminal domain-containing protein [Halonotius terrestris]TQQ83390.1 histidine kinase [Halonotius terrestris]
MEATYSTATGTDLRETLAAVADSDGVNGLLLLATPSVDVASDEFAATLAGLSVPAFGGVFPAVIHEGTAKESGLLAVGLPATPDVTVLPNASDPDADFADTLDPELPANGYETAFVFVDAYAEAVPTVIESLFRTYGVGMNFIGGGAGQLDDDRGPSVFTNDGVFADAAVIAAVEQPIEIGVQHGWETLDGPFRVTGSEGPTVTELDGSPAFSVYQEVIESQTETSVTRENFFEVAQSHPFGITRLDAEQIVRDPFAVEGDALTCFGSVPEGEFVNILTGDDESLIAAAAAAYESAVGDDTDGSLYAFDCISRSLYLDDDFDRELAAVDTGDRPVVGALTIGEIANDGSGHLDYYNKTAVIGAVRNE